MFGQALKADEEAYLLRRRDAAETPDDAGELGAVPPTLLAMLVQRLGLEAVEARRSPAEPCCAPL